MSWNFCGIMFVGNGLIPASYKMIKAENENIFCLKGFLVNSGDEK